MWHRAFATGTRRDTWRRPDFDEEEPSGNRLLRLAGQFWAWLFLLVLVIFFSVTGRGFFDLFNFQAIGANASRSC